MGTGPKEVLAEKNAEAAFYEKTLRFKKNRRVSKNLAGGIRTHDLYHPNQQKSNSVFPVIYW
jgi:hypothetical protein